jgi:uncharacterized membrane protein HdeD (DUF308 family)
MTTSTTDTADAVAAFGKKWWLLLLLGVVSVAAGIASLNHPVSATWSLTVLFGVWLLVSGIGTVVRSLSADSEGSHKTLGLISGLLSISIAFMFFHGGIADKVVIASLFIGITFVFRGSAELVAGLAAKGQPGRGWAIFMGIVTMIAGLIMINNPATSLVAITQVIAVFLLILGFMEIFSAFQVRKLAK